MEIWEIEDICRILKISKSTAYSLVRNNELAAFKLHGIWKITNTALIAYLNQKQEKGENIHSAQL